MWSRSNAIDLSFSWNQVGGGPVRTVHVERRRIVLVGDPPSAVDAAQAPSGAEPHIDPAFADLLAPQVDQAVAIGDARLRGHGRRKFGDLLPDRAGPGGKPRVPAGHVPHVGSGVCQWRGQIELADVGCIVSDETLWVLGAQGSEPVIQHAAYFGHSLRLGDRHGDGYSSLRRPSPGHATRGVI